MIFGHLSAATCGGLIQAELVSPSTSSNMGIYHFLSNCLPQIQLHHAHSHPLSLIWGAAARMQRGSLHVCRRSDKKHLCMTRTFTFSDDVFDIIWVDVRVLLIVDKRGVETLAVEDGPGKSQGCIRINTCNTQKEIAEKT
jgi:hypothetical protein